MINSVSNVSFKANPDLAAPGKFSAQPALTEMQPDSFESEKKSSKAGLAAGLSVAALLGAFVGLGYAVKNGKLEKIAKEAMPEGFMNKAWAHIKNFGATIGEYGKKCITTVEGWFGKKGEKVAEAVQEGAEQAAEAAAK